MKIESAAKSCLFSAIAIVVLVLCVSPSLFAQSDRPEITPVFEENLSGQDLANHEFITFRMELKPGFSNTVPPSLLPNILVIGTTQPVLKRFRHLYW